MFYFSKTSDFKLDKYDFDFNVIPKLTKFEQEFLEKLIKNHKDDLSIDTYQFKPDYYNEIHRLVLSLSKKTVELSIKIKENEYSKYYCHLFDFISMENDKIFYSISREIFNSKREGNFFSRINFSGILLLKYDYSKELFKIILKSLKKSGVFEYDLDKFKEILKINSNNYTRYYNFENKVLNPIIKDLESVGVFLKFEKIKQSSGKTARITGIKIHYKNVSVSILYQDVNDILKLYSEHISDFTIAYEKVYDIRKTHSRSETFDIIEKNYKTIFTED